MPSPSLCLDRVMVTEKPSWERRTTISTPQDLQGSEKSALVRKIQSMAKEWQFYRRLIAKVPNQEADKAAELGTIALREMDLSSAEAEELLRIAQNSNAFPSRQPRSVQTVSADMLLRRVR